MSEPYLWRDLMDGTALEHRSDIVVEGKPLLCGSTRDGTFAAGPGTDFPAAYIEATVQEAQDALRQVVGVRHALVTLTVRVTPYAVSLQASEDETSPAPVGPG